MKKSYPHVLILFAGAAMIVAGFLIGDEALKALSGVLIGVGAGLLGMSLANLGMAMHYKKYPDNARKAAIEEKDERSVIINAKAKASAGDVTKWFIIALAFVMILFDAPLWATLSIVGLFTLYHVLFFIYLARYQKQM